VNKNFKSGYIAIIGKPNVGKSTLMNNLLDIKLSITSPRPQTTRRRVMGIFNNDEMQIVFLDTPGILKPKYNLQREMMSYVNLSISDADLLMFMTEHNKKDSQVELDVEKLKILNPEKKPVLLVINKVDITGKSELLPLIQEYSEKYPFISIIPISAKTKDGFDELLNLFKQNLPLHPPFYDTDLLTDQPEKFFVAELIREKIFYQFQKEIPYSTEVEISDFKEREKGKYYISAIIYVERDSQKGIVIGKKGESLKKLSKSSRLAIEEFINHEIFLELVVRVKKNWRKDDKMLRQFGY